MIPVIVFALVVTAAGLTWMHLGTCAVRGCRQPGTYRSLTHARNVCYLHFLKEHGF